MERYNLVVFDLYGTLIQFGTPHHPFRKILKWAHEQGRQPLTTDARTLMTINDKPESLFRAMGILVPDDLLQSFQQEIQEELDSLTLFNDVIPTLEKLIEAKIGLAICSNLAKPYGTIIDRLLPDFSFTRILSFEVGYIKPEHGIYEAIVNKTDVHKENILFVGDTFVADYEGPVRYGFKALHLCREGRVYQNQIEALSDIISLI